MTEPRTEAGRLLFSDVDTMDMWESNGVTPDEIVAVEAEARRDALTALREQVEGLPLTQEVAFVLAAIDRMIEL